MRARDRMHRDANWALKQYAHLTQPEDMRVVRLAADVMGLLGALGEADETIEQLLQFKCSDLACPSRMEMGGKMTRTIDEIRASCKAATPGPWEYNGFRGVTAPAMNGTLDDDLGIAVHWKPNADFIANARQDIPDLLAALAEKDAEMAIVRDGLLVLLRKSQDDVVILTAKIEEKDAEIERLQLAARRFSRKIAGLPE